MNAKLAKSGGWSTTRRRTARAAADMHK